MEISYVADRLDLAIELIPGLLAHWRAFLPEDSWESRLTRFQSHMNRRDLPIAWVAHDGAHVLGTAALRRYDLPGFEALSPWLGGVFVAPEFRKRGVATSLCRFVEARASELGFERIYLFTLDQQALYARMGWRTIERVSWNGHAADLMTKELRAG
jgi:predicted N-acetyltransferase YhbS